MMKLFIVGYLQLVFLSLNGRNNAQSRYAAYFLTSMCITFTWVYVIRSVSAAGFGFLETFIYGLGCSCGGVSGIWIHKTFLKRKETDKW